MRKSGVSYACKTCNLCGKMRYYKIFYFVDDFQVFCEDCVAEMNRQIVLHREMCERVMGGKIPK